MNRLLGEPQNPRTFWLVLLLAVILLVGVSASPAAADAGQPTLAREVGAIAALGEALQRPPVEPSASPVHPELADGGSLWLANLSVRRVRSLRRQLEALEGEAAEPAATAHHRLALEVDRVHWQLLAFRHGEDDPVRLGHSLAALAAAGGRAGESGAARTAGQTPRILRGASF
ncbi:MAG: hypothetical protein R3349_12160 [Geminicoccaceae bacterium]|nr:hypothetical protein [Geminicoccaceae bacterium]